ncbi:MAG: DUF3800 domain-containing protein [Terracidiphilus sp.]
MLKLYVDDSGSDPNDDGLFVLYGYLMEEKRWEDFAERWDAQLKRPDFFPIDYCRMADAEEGTGPFVGIDRVFRNRKVMDLAQVIRECLPTAIGCKMTWKSYNEIVKGKVDSRLDNPYAILFFMVMRSVTDLQIKMLDEITEEAREQVKKEQGIEIAVKPVEFIFDDQGPAGLQCLQWWGSLKGRVGPPHSIVLANTPQFKDDRQLVSLQAADMLAWHIRREFEYPTEDRTAVFDLINPAGVWEREISDDMLRQVVDRFNNRVDLSKL